MVHCCSTVPSTQKATLFPHSDKVVCFI